MNRIPLLAVLFVLAIAGGLLSMVLAGVFGLVTLRKLGKNPQTQGCMGMHVYPWGQALSVASVMTLPRGYERWRRRGRVGYLFADGDVILAHTTRLDRWLGRTCYSLAMFSAALLGVVLVIHSVF